MNWWLLWEMWSREWTLLMLYHYAPELYWLKERGGF